jgi:thiopeptide-type bacteriocin biosynthesis protein
VLPAFHELVEPWLGNRRIHRVQLDTYVRETRRYGGPDAIEACEELFFTDSRAVASFLENASGDDGLDLRSRFAFVAMDRLLDDLGFEVEAKHALTDRLATLFGLEFRLDGDLRAKLRDRYRDERRSLDDALAERGDAARELDVAYDLLRVRSESSRNASATLRRLSAANALTVPIEEIAAGLLHMHANRALRSANRAHEMILYRFLEKAYASQLARRKARVTKP